jgi:hypothetical protein
MGKHDLLKIKSFRTCHIAVRRAQTPTLMFVFSDLTTSLSQFPNICAILREGVIFFFKMGAKCPSLCIKMMHTALFREGVILKAM